MTHPTLIETANNLMPDVSTSDNSTSDVSFVQRPYFSFSTVALLQRKLDWFDAARRGDLAKLQAIFPATDRQNSLNDDEESSGLTALGLAAAGGHLATLQWLLKQRAWAYYGGRDNQSPLQLAIEGGQDEVACWLIENGADLNALDQTGTSPIRAAAKSGNIAIARLLLDKGAIARGGTTYGIYPAWTSLLVAIKYGHLPLVQLLFEAGVPIPSRTPDGIDVLELATQKLATQSDNDELVEWLLNNG